MSSLVGGMQIRKREGFLHSVRRYHLLYVMLVPGVIWYFIFKYLPMYGIIIAFQDFNIYDGFLGSEFVGLQWFRTIMGDPNFFRILWNTVKFSLASLVFGFPFPIFFALLLNELRLPVYKRVIQTVTYLPHFFTWVIAGGMVLQFMSWFGPLNNFLFSFGIERTQFFADSRYFVPIYVLSGIWKEFGWGSIIYLAAIAGINPELYEAAIIDGANKVRQAWHITLPGIRPIIVISLILRSGTILRVGFDHIYVLSNDLIRSSTDVFATYIYRVGIRGGAYSYTAAIGLFQSLVALMFIILTNRIAKSFGESGIW